MERRHNFALVRAITGEQGAAKLRLDEELSVENAVGRVKGGARDGRIDY